MNELWNSNPGKTTLSFAEIQAAVARVIYKELSEEFFSKVPVNKACWAYERLTKYDNLLEWRS